MEIVVFIGLVAFFRYRPSGKQQRRAFAKLDAARDSLLTPTEAVS